MTHVKIHQSTVVQGLLRSDLPNFKVGSIVAVYYKIKEGGKERIQIFKGLVTNRHQINSIDATFTVAKNSVNGVKVERTFPLHSPNIDKIVVETLQRAKRSNLNSWAMKVKDPAKSLRSKPVKTSTKAVTQPATKAEKVEETTKTEEEKE